jgi:hypothetical protein
MPFSVGAGAAALGDVVVVVVVVEVVEGACSPLLPHPAANAVSAISAQPLATAILRRLIRPVITISVPFMLSGNRFELATAGEVSIVAVHAGRFGGRRGCLDLR